MRFTGVRYRRYGYRRELLELLVKLVKDMDRKIERQKERAAKESEARLLTTSDKAQLDALKVRTLRNALLSTLPPWRCKARWSTSWEQDRIAVC